MTEIDIENSRYAAEELVICYLTQVCHPISLQFPRSSLTTQDLSFLLTPVKIFRVYVEDARRTNRRPATACRVIYGCPVRDLTLCGKVRAIYSGIGAEQKNG